ncbi:hypothetical protein WJX73_010375 [Symbiochloris irregularis]|uniref:Uncharacterized protein n=1 Tax=Symbiochloris irregularis TaxID=706552 RepID=A0AAW1P018_9CHLO
MSQLVPAQAKKRLRSRDEAEMVQEPSDNGSCRYAHLDSFSTDHQEWLQKTADVELLTGTGTRHAAHAASLIQWSSVLGNCITATIAAAASGAPEHFREVMYIAHKYDIQMLLERMEQLVLQEFLTKHPSNSSHSLTPAIFWAGPAWFDKQAFPLRPIGLNGRDF